MYGIVTQGNTDLAQEAGELCYVNVWEFLQYLK